jgi:hypothetical protein
MKVRLFVDGCMKTADSHDFCASIPKQSEYLKRAEWSIGECQRRGMPNDQRCSRIMQAVGQACDTEASK